MPFGLEQARRELSRGRELLRARPGRTRRAPSRGPHDTPQGPFAPCRAPLARSGVPRAGSRGRRSRPCSAFSCSRACCASTSIAARVCPGSNSSRREARPAASRASRSYSGRRPGCSTATPSARAVFSACSAARISSFAARSLSSRCFVGGPVIVHRPLGLVEVLHGPCEEVAPAHHLLSRPDGIRGEPRCRLVELPGRNRRSWRPRSSPPTTPPSSGQAAGAGPPGNPRLAALSRRTRPGGW